MSQLEVKIELRRTKNQTSTNLNMMLPNQNKKEYKKNKLARS